MTDPSPIDASRRRHPSLEPVTQDQFAHPSERAFARLLNLYGFAWSYEPVEFPLEWNEFGVPVKAFRPDFYLPERRLFIEAATVLEQRLVTKKNQKVRKFRVLYPEVELLVVYQRDFVALLEQHGLGTLDTFAA